MIVADANLIVSLVTDSSRTALARAIHAKDSVWLAPPLWRYESINALLNLFQADRLDREEAFRAMESASQVVLENTEGCSATTIFETAQNSHLTAYDAAYVVLARSLGVSLITEDKQILRACPDVACSMEQFLAGRTPPTAVKERKAKYRARKKPSHD